MAVTINGTTGIVTPDLGVDGTTLVVDAANDRVGIGQSSPTKKLEVGGGAVSFSPDVAGKHTHEFTTNAANDARYFLRSDTTTKVDIQANGVTYFNGGNVGINTTNADQKLSVLGLISTKAPDGITRGLIGSPSWDTSYVAMMNGTLAQSASNSAVFQNSLGTTTLNSASGQELYLKIGNSKKLTIKSDGKAYFANNLGLGGQTAPTSYLHINNYGNDGYELKLSGNAVQFNRSSNSYIDQVHDTGSILFRMTSSHTEAMRIDSSGRITANGVNVNNAWDGGDDLVLGGTGSGTRTGITLVSGSDADGGLYWSHGTGNDRYAGQIAYNHNNDRMTFYTNSQPEFCIDSGGKISIGGNHSPLNQLHILDDTTSSWDGSLNKSRAVLRLETHYNALGGREIDDYGSGIVFNHLGGHSAQHGDDSHAFIGIRVNDTAGHERSKLIFATNNETTTAAHDSGLKEAMHIKPNGSIHMAFEKNDIGALPGNVVNQKLTIMTSSSAYPGSHVLFAGQFNGNWEEGTTGHDSCYGLGWVYQAQSKSSQSLRAGIAYDHKGTEEFKYWSSYGAHTWYVDSGTSGTETAETCSTKAMQISKFGSVINRAKPDYGIYTESGVQTINGGSKNVQYLEDCYGQWIVVAKIQQLSHIQSAMKSVAQIDTSLGGATGTEWSCSFGDNYPIAVRYVSSSKWSEWRDYRGVDFIHGVPHGRKWKNFFTNGASSGMTSSTGGVGSAKYGWTCDGAWDGKGRWHNPTFNWFRMSDTSGYQSQYVSESFFTTATASTAGTALFLNYANDAKFGVHHFSNTGGQDTAVTSVYGFDDNLVGHEDNFPNAPANNGGTDITAMPLWICINVGSIGQFN